MYNLILEKKGKLEMPTNRYYAKELGITESYISKALKGELPIKTPLAKGIISIAYGIPINDEQMKELLEKHFKERR